MTMTSQDSAMAHLLPAPDTAKANFNISGRLAPGDIAVPELPHEEASELQDRFGRFLDGVRPRGVHRRDQARQILHAQTQDSRANHRPGRVAPLVELREEGRRVFPEIEPRVIP